MSNTDQSSDASGGFSDSSVDSRADGEINTLVDDVAARIPGGSSYEETAKTDIDKEANTLINGEIGKLEGMFGHKDE